MWFLCSGHFTGAAELTLGMPLAPRGLWAPHGDHGDLGGWLTILQIYMVIFAPLNHKFQSVFVLFGSGTSSHLGSFQILHIIICPFFLQGNFYLGWSHTQTSQSLAVEGCPQVAWLCLWKGPSHDFLVWVPLHHCPWCRHSSCPRYSFCQPDPLQYMHHPTTTSSWGRSSCCPAQDRGEVPLPPSPYPPAFCSPHQATGFTSGPIN